MSIIYTNNRSRKKQPRGKGWQTKVYYKKMKKPEFKPYRPEPSLQSQLAWLNIVINILVWIVCQWEKVLLLRKNQTCTLVH